MRLSFISAALASAAVTLGCTAERQSPKPGSGLICLTLYGDLSVKDVTVRRPDGASCDSLHLSCTAPLKLSPAKPTTIYVVAPPFESPEGICISYGIGNGRWERRTTSSFRVERSEITTVVDTLSEKRLYHEFNVPAISMIDDDFSGVSNDGTLSPEYASFHDFCIDKGIRMDFAICNSLTDADVWMPEGRVAVCRKWQDEGFGFLCHPIHSQGWYNYDASHPHDASLVEASAIKAKRDLGIYGLHCPDILVWPGDSQTFEDNQPIVRRHFDAAVTSTYKGVNHNADEDRYNLKRTSFQCLTRGYHTKTSFKQAIKDAVEAGDWLILGSHIYSADADAAPDETTYSIANICEILEYADSLCPLELTGEVWAKRKTMYDILGK